MNRSAIGLKVVGTALVALLASLPTTGNAQSNTASVSIAIRVGPIAEIEFPKGTGFELSVQNRDDGLSVPGGLQPDNAPIVAGAQIPFRVVGNAWATVSANPIAMLDGPSRRGAGSRSGAGSAGKAVSVGRLDSGAELPYELWVEFPASNPGRSSAGAEIPSGKNLTDNSIARASVANGPVSGIVHIVPRRSWGDAASSGYASPGLYRGAVEITLSATTG